MYDILRDSGFGHLARFVTGRRVFQFPEERPGFELPESYYNESMQRMTDAAKDAAAGKKPLPQDQSPDEKPPSRRSLSSSSSERKDSELGLNSESNLAIPKEEENGIQKAETARDLERAPTAGDLEKTVSRPIAPTRTREGYILVDWYTTDDPENPQNWGSGKKAIVVLQIYLYTLAVYMGSAIYTPSVPYVIEVFGVSSTVALLGLSLYVLGYGVGPLLWSPLSEIPVVGRNPPYLFTFGIFVILSIPTALVDNIGGLLVLRFLQGFFGSPCLATGGASLGDVTDLLHLSYFLTGWAGFATAGPALGPVISGFSVPAEGWRWSLWEILWLSGPVFLSMFFLLPETSANNILLRRAKRIRKLTGNPIYKSQSELDQQGLTAKSVAYEALVRPWILNALDPAILFSTVYVMIVYGIYYSFFEVFPIVYMQGYGMNIGQMGLVFLVIAVSVGIAIPTYFAYLRYHFTPYVMKNGFSNPEHLLIPALFGSFGPPIGLFVFGWTGRPDIHWIVPTIGIAIYTVGVFILLQSLFIYIPMIYPQYAASLFAGNDAARSAFAAGAILFADPLFHTLGVGKGCSLLGGLAAGCCLGVFALYYYGADLRQRSRFTVKAPVE
ncbi:hypothetical protein H072_10244 [Dactylellina haptotyla CBS 200.50]|uniref:Major facilitator superfamily (MFS) profile domain-containing protein n=1 Tax=Dactylellina haptotyla (strain CBS 200.50) TaxID=1284197 RepID=S8BLN4_DACHA|nr:hypothetical protein H072_10244 [Dactylellina haptotyla CBS 200.50]